MHVIKNVCVVFFLVLSFSYSSSGQFFDSIRTAIKKKPKLIFKLDARNSFISNNKSRIVGWKIGVDFNNKFRIGGGISNLSKNHSPFLDRVIYDSKGQDTIAIAPLSFGYFSYFIDSEASS